MWMHVRDRFFHFREREREKKKKKAPTHQKLEKMVS